MKKIFNTTLGLTLLTTMLLIGGCKKAATIDGHVASSTENYTTPTGTTTTVTTSTYDSQGRLVLQQVTGKSPVSLSYSNGQVTATSGTSTPTVFTLNSAGYATSDGSSTYVYDNNGYNTVVSNSSPGATSVVNTINSGNVASSTQTTNGVASTYSYTYLSTKDYREYGLDFLGKNSVDLINAETVSNPTSSTYTFSYTFDGKGRVQTQMWTSGTTSDVTSYTYTTN